MADPLVKMVLCPGGPDNARNSEASCIELRDGRLLLVWWHFYTGEGEDDSPGEVAARYSADRGRSWSDTVVLQPNVARQTTGSPSLLRLKDGRIAFFYGTKNADDDLPFFVRFSSDESATWSEPVLVTTEPGYWVMNNDRAVQLSWGRIIAPVAWANDCYRPAQPWQSTVFYSDDGGHTWRRSRTWLRLECASGAQEPGVIELKDGRVMMFCRTTERHPFISFSEDGGETWSDLVAMENVWAPCSPTCMKRIPSTGDLLMVWNNRAGSPPELAQRRTPLTLAISRDEGRTWEHAKNLEDDPDADYAYTSITFLDDEVLFTYYEYFPGRAPWLSLKLTIAPISWLYS